MLNKLTLKKKQKPLADEENIDEKKLPINMTPTLWETIAPDGLKIDPSSEDTGIMKQSLATKTYFRPFYISRDGFPRKMRTNWLYSLTSSGEVDVLIDIHKVKKNEAIKLLQRQDTILKSNLTFQAARGNQDQIMDLRTKIEDTNMLMEEIQFNENDLYHTGVLGVLYGNSEDELEKYSEYIEDEMSAQFFKIVSTWGRVKKGLRSVSPFVKNEISDSLRNIDRRSLTTFAPFISGSGKYNGGIPFGKNLITGQKEFYNAFGTAENRPDNYNMATFGQSGSGKSLAMKMQLARETIAMAMYTRLIDVDGEYVKITKRLNGINLNLSEESDIRINPLAINVSNIPIDDEDDEELALLEVSDEREIIEKQGKKYVSFVPIKEKINEVLGFFDIVLRGQNQADTGINVFERNYIEEAMKFLYGEGLSGYTSHPSSLYQQQPLEVNGKIVMEKVRKPEPTLSDVYKYITDKYQADPKAERLVAALRPFLSDGSKPIFDGQTYLGKGVDTDMNKARVVNFNISSMEEGFLRPIAYQVIFNYLWEYFVKNPDNYLLKKIIVCDEFWTMVDHEQTVSFAEKVARRARKRNAGLRIASQDFVRILKSDKARGVLQNTHTFFFLKQTKMDQKEIVANFELSQGELQKLFQNPDKGEGILKVGNSSVWIRTDPSEDEMVFIESNTAHLDEHRSRRQFRKGQPNY